MLKSSLPARTLDPTSVAHAPSKRQRGIQSIEAGRTLQTQVEQCRFLTLKELTAEKWDSLHTPGTLGREMASRAPTPDPKLKSRIGVAALEATLNKSLARCASPLGAVCSAANSRDGCGCCCGSRLASHSHAGRPAAETCSARP